MQPAPAGSLLQVLQRIPDPRGRQGRRHPFGAMLATIVCSILCGARSYSAIADWLHAQEPAFWHALGLAAAVIVGSAMWDARRVMEDQEQKCPELQYRVSLGRLGDLLNCRFEVGA